jgi:hypothetical protein
MALDFPSSPNVGATYTASGVTWVWDGAKWEPSSNASGPFLQLVGGTMTGPLILSGDATTDLGAATREQVHARMPGTNRIINGDMRIDQRNGGGVVGVTSGTPAYPVDRFFSSGSQIGKLNMNRVPGAGTAAVGFPYYLNVVSLTAYTPLATDAFGINQAIEGDAIADLLWGTPNAQPVTLSFWANTTVPGLYSGSIANGDGSRSYPFTFNLTGVLQKIIINIPGDTTGNWTLSGNGRSMLVRWDMGCGVNYRGPVNVWQSNNIVGATGSVSLVSNNGASFALTGVKLEIGNIASPYTQQSLAKSMADCQRYFSTSYLGQGAIGTINTNGMIQFFLNGVSTATLLRATMMIYFPVSMRASPTMTYYSPATGAVGMTRDYVNSADVAIGSQAVPGLNNISVQMNLGAAATAINMGCHYVANAEI